jgi:thiamine biosynthesis lipoprotein
MSQRTLSGIAMGSTWAVTVILSGSIGPSLETLREGIQARLDNVDRQMSTWKPESDLSRFNRAAAGSWHSLPVEFFTVLSYALVLARDSSGAYDPTVGPLIDLWGFGAGRQLGDMPSSVAISTARARQGWQLVQIDPAARRAYQPGGIQLDLSSVAKGFSVDEVARYLDAAGIRAYLIEVGGELFARGCKVDRSPWRVGIERPGAAVGAPRYAGDIEKVISLRDQAIATSGDYRHFFERGGMRYSHHIDPRSGCPAAHAVASVSIVADECMRADSLGTTMTVLGPEQGMAYALAHDLAVFFILYSEQGFEERMSPAFDKALQSS